MRVARKRPEISFVLVGDGPYRAELQQQMPNAEFPGFLTGEALSRAYASADIFLFPSATDTFGNVVLEAMSSGLPVIVGHRMGPAELVREGETGFIAKSEELFLEKLDFLATNGASRRIMSRLAREYALGRNWDSVLGDLFEQYRRVMEGEVSKVTRRSNNQIKKRKEVSWAKGSGF
jgi:glycosyltransferase involved in cell wall biosynthesis